MRFAGLIWTALDHGFAAIHRASWKDEALEPLKAACVFFEASE
jgi:hypothetical protein